ncbi:MAG: DUF1343 domain-containing protein [Bacteroidota bacterium]
MTFLTYMEKKIIHSISCLLLKPTSILLFFFTLHFQACTTSNAISNEISKPTDNLVRTGIEVLKSKQFKMLEGKKVGLITNATGVDSKLTSTVDILFKAKNVQLTALYGPEHGVRGDHTAGEKVAQYNDEATGLPVYSLYGKTRKPNKEMLANIDVLVYDIQDIGCRSYTFISTMGKAMEAAAEFNKEFVVLDRPNPIGGNRVEGNIVEEGFESFVSPYKIPYLYGLTCGELAHLLNDEGFLTNGVKCKLKVVTMQGWERDMSFEDTGLEWVPTSPHIPHKQSPFYYPATGIIGELYAISIGVGYTLPFQTFAAEWINPHSLAAKLNSFGLKGVNFRPLSFKPYYSSMKGKNLNGVQIHITDFEAVNLSSLQFYFFQAHHALYPEKNLFKLCDESRWSMFDKVCGTDKIRESLMKEGSFEKIKWYWEKDVETFTQLSKDYHLY